MKTSHLHEMWGGPDNSRLVKTQFSFRLPVHVAAKIFALGDMYPSKNRTQIVADLLTAALDDLEKNLPMVKGDLYDAPWDPDGTPYFEVAGSRGKFRRLANRHYKEIEKDLGTENPKDLYEDLYESEENFK